MFWIAVLVLVVVGTGLAWWSSGRAAPRLAPVRAVEHAAAYVDRDAPHNSATCQVAGFEHRIGF